MAKTPDRRFDRTLALKAFRKRFRRAYRALEDAIEESDEPPLTRTEIGQRMAERLNRGRSPNAVSEWWTGKSIPDTIPMAALADILGVSPGWLAFGEGDMRGYGPAPGTAPDPDRRPRATPTDVGARRQRVDDAENAEDDDQAEEG